MWSLNHWTSREFPKPLFFETTDEWELLVTRKNPAYSDWHNDDWGPFLSNLPNIAFQLYKWNKLVIRGKKVFVIFSLVELNSTCQYFPSLDPITLFRATWQCFRDWSLPSQHLWAFWPLGWNPHFLSCSICDARNNSKRFLKFWLTLSRYFLHPWIIIIQDNSRDSLRLLTSSSFLYLRSHNLSVVCDVLR